MPKCNNARQSRQDPSSAAATKRRGKRPGKRRRGRSSSPEPPISELIMLGLTPEQWSLMLDPCHRRTAVRLALKIANHVVNTDELMRCAQKALIAAVRAYDPASDACFATHARRRMRQAICERMRERQIPERFLRWQNDLIMLVALSQ